MPEYLPLVVHSTNAPKKPQLLNSNRKKKSPSLKHLWHLDQPPIGPIKLNNNGMSLIQNQNHKNNALTFKDCHKKLSSMGACISLEEEYKNHTCYYCKTCHRKQWGHLIKRNRKWDNTSCLTCGDMLPKKCNWIDVAMKGGVCNQTCQYALSIAEKVKKRTPFNMVYNSTFNKLYHYPHNAEMIFDLTKALINGATKEDVYQMKEAEYIEYTIELAGFDYEDKVEVYYQIASHIYPTQEAQIQ
ncbi:hypothetical protein G9A89_023247 [Geosiphon pyriformis]|nr:hypothetical protein G9A89_023247 [Geosiphon pyriformis]